MNKDDAEQIIRILLGKNTSDDERNAIINGILFGIGFANYNRRPNWSLIKKLVEDGRDITWWIEIEDKFFDMNKKMIDDFIELWESLRKEK
jgi:hypothetical protein